jgi:hypothetical protein
MALAVAATVATLAPAAQSDEVWLTPGERTALAVTVYASGYGLISDRRLLPTRTGAFALGFAEVSRQIVADSALLATDGDLRVTGLDYRSAVLSPETLLRRSLGRQVGIVRTHPTTGDETVEWATVLAVRDGVVLRYRDRIEAGIPGRMVFESAPVDLRPVPTLAAMVESTAAKPLEVELTYLTGGVGWQADYVAEVNAGENRVDLTGRATVRNSTGIDLRDMQLALVAGEPRRVTPPAETLARAMPQAAAMPASPPTPERETFGDLHLYKLDRPITVADGDSRQLTLLAARDVPLTHEYYSESDAAVYRVQQAEERFIPAEVGYRFDNAANPGPGVPLPAGIVRIYRRDGAGVRRLVGEDQISHTPVGQTVALHPGRAFDVTVKRTQTAFVRAGLPEKATESAHRIEIGNAKDVAVTVKVVEILAANWRILEESAGHQKEAADRAVWRIPVAAHGSAQLTYRVRIDR